MAVAAFASLVSLTQVLDNVHYRAQLNSLHADIKQIETLRGSIDILLKFVENHSGRKGQRIEHSWRQLSEAAFEVEEIFDLHVVNQLQLGSQRDQNDLVLPAFSEDIERMIQKIGLIKKELLVFEEVHEDEQIIEQPRGFVPTRGSSAISSNGKNIIVGFEEHESKIMEVLFRDEADLQILSVVGMGGIGKTTLVKSIFDNQLIVDHFDIRIWLTISQEYDVHEILLGLLNDGVLKRHRGNFNSLEDMLYKTLFDRRYLIVLDDVWTTQVWDDLRLFFPNDCKGSRIMMTTRLSYVARSLGSHSLYPLTFLDEDTAWKLFCQTIFKQEDCLYPELEEIGKKIAKSCRGLPLEIIVVGGLLANTNMMKEHWELVAENVSSFCTSTDEEHCSQILLLSYNNLPIYLKPCFLYMGIFPEDDKIDVSRLITRWVAEGFIKVKGDKSLEEISKEYFKDLLDRNLIFIRERVGALGKEQCGIHDLLRELCLNESKKEHFIRSPKVQYIDLVFERRVCFLCSSRRVADEDQMNLPTLLSQNNPYICGACKRIYSDIKGLRLVKVLDSNSVVNAAYESLVQHTKLRYASVVRFYGSGLHFLSPSTLHLLWNLQTLFIYTTSRLHPLVLPSEFWEMRQLRHVEIRFVVLPEPLVAHNWGEEDCFVLENLRTLSHVMNFKFTNEAIDRIPNLEELTIRYDKGMKSSDASLCNLARLQKLEKLHVNNASKNIGFPSSLKELNLVKCRIPWNDVSIIGALPNLENLVLYDAEGSEWNPVEGEFLQLKRLVIGYTDLAQWTADETHFPNLEWLELDKLQFLEEIPSGIRDIPNLSTVRMYDCSESSVYSAKQIWEEEQSMGNLTLEIYVHDDEGWHSIGDVPADEDNNS